MSESAEQGTPKPLESLESIWPEGSFSHGIHYYRGMSTGFAVVPADSPLLDGGEISRYNDHLLIVSAAVSDMPPEIDYENRYGISDQTARIQGFMLEEAEKKKAAGEQVPAGTRLKTHLSVREARLADSRRLGGAPEPAPEQPETLQPHNYKKAVTKLRLWFARYRRFGLEEYDIDNF